MATESTVTSISDFVQIVCELNRQVSQGRQMRDYSLLFRGQSDKNYTLLPTIGRGRTGATACTIFNDERNLIEMAKYRLPEVFRNDLTPIELLALLQHHGIPTRLLDVSESALVALYFACCNASEKDGEVIVFKCDNDDVTNYPVANAIADTYRFTVGTWTTLSSFYNNVKSQPYFLEQKNRMDVIHKDDNEGGQWIAECCQKIRYLYAPIRSLRQQNQHGRYILFPNHICEFSGEDCFEWLIKAIPKDHEDILSRIIIPKEIKQQLLEGLSVLGITASFLFCDSVDSVCKGIVDMFKRRY